MDKIILNYEDFKFLMTVLDDTISEYAGAKEIIEVYIPKYEKLQTLLRRNEKDV